MGLTAKPTDLHLDQLREGYRATKREATAAWDAFVGVCREVSEQRAVCHVQPTHPHTGDGWWEIGPQGLVDCTQSYSSTGYGVGWTWVPKPAAPQNPDLGRRWYEAEQEHRRTAIAQQEARRALEAEVKDWMEAP